MPINEQQLGQLRPANTTAASLYSPAAVGNTIIKSIVVANTSGSNAKFRIFLDEDGSTFDETTALFWDISISKGSTTQIDTYYAMDDAAGNLGVRTDTNDALTFTASGAVIT